MPLTFSPEINLLPPDDGRLAQATPQAGAAGPIGATNAQSSEALTKRTFDLLAEASGADSSDEALERITKRREIQMHQLGLVEQSLNSRMTQRISRRQDKILGAPGRTRQIMDVKLQLARATVEHQFAESKSKILNTEATFTSMLAKHAEGVESVEKRRKVASDLIAQVERGEITGVGGVNRALLNNWVEVGGAFDQGEILLPPKHEELHAAGTRWEAMAESDGAEATLERLEWAIENGYEPETMRPFLESVIGSAGERFTQGQAEAQREGRKEDLAIEKAEQDVVPPRIVYAGGSASASDHEFAFVVDPKNPGKHRDEIIKKWRDTTLDGFVVRAGEDPRVRTYMRSLGIGEDTSEWMAPNVLSRVKENKEAAQALADSMSAAMKVMRGPDTSPHIATYIMRIYPDIWSLMRKDDKSLAEMGLMSSADPGEQKAAGEAFSKHQQELGNSVLEELARREQGEANAAAPE